MESIEKTTKKTTPVLRLKSDRVSADQELVIRVRRALGCSQTKLAAALGTCRDTVILWEKGKRVHPMKPKMRQCLEMLLQRKLRPRNDVYTTDFSHLNDRPSDGVEQRCREHLNVFLEKCSGDRDKLGWTSVTLVKTFPLDMWDEAISHSEKQSDT